MKFYRIEKFKVSDDSEHLNEYLIKSVYNEKNDEIMRLIKDDFFKIVEMIDFDQGIARIHNIPEKFLAVIKENEPLEEFKYNGTIDDALKTEENYIKLRILNDLRDNITPIEKAIRK